jgi:hypothetical protein
MGDQGPAGTFFHRNARGGFAPSLWLPQPGLGVTAHSKPDTSGGVIRKGKRLLHVSLGIATLHTIIRKNFSGYKVKTSVPYTLLYLHEASGIYGPKTLEIPG